jgi:trehalose 6-phosphate synthase
MLRGLLGSDLISFHLEEHCDSFLESVTRETAAEVHRGLRKVTQAERMTRVRPDPVSVDFEEISRKALSQKSAQDSDEWRARLSLGSQRVLLSVGRFDYAEGVPERVRAFGRLLELHPEYRGKIALLEIAIPIRGSLPTYSRFQSQAVAMIEEVNRTYGTVEWRPVIVLSEHLNLTALIAFYLLADVCLVTSLHEGMSLVAKEYVSARPDGRGALILSTCSGAARELRQAILVNPFDVRELSGAMRHALELSVTDRETMLHKLRAVVKTRNVFRWAGKLFKEALTVQSLPSAFERDQEQG